MSVSNRPKLGSHLEWHGQKIRVKVRVPPLVQQSAKLPAWLKEGLPTDSPRAAETLKWPVIARLKKRIDDARNGVVSGTEADPIVAEGMLWREAIAEDQPSASSDVTARQALEDRVDTIAHQHGEAKAELLAGIALGTATPLESLIEDWIAEKAYKGRTEAARRHALKRFKEWSSEKKVPATIEAVNRKIAGRFIADAFVTAGAHPATANKAISGLSSYWDWLGKRGHIEEGVNPWHRQFLKVGSGPKGEDGQGVKRPFTDDEAKKLLAGITKQPLAVTLPPTSIQLSVRSDGWICPVGRAERRGQTRSR